MAYVTGNKRPTEDDWKRLGRAIADRRFELGLSQEALVKLGGPSHQIVRNVERGVVADYRDSTFYKFDRALRWPDGTAKRILDGTATEEEVETVVPRIVERGGRAAATVQGTGHADLGFAATAPAPEPQPERSATRNATIVTVAELLRCLREERDRTPSMDDAEEALLRLLPELYGRDRGDT